MKRQAHAKKRDANELEIVRALEKIGATVERMDDPVDLLVGYRSKTYLIEVKAARGKLTGDQVDFIANWKGSPIYVVRDAETAIDIVSREPEPL